MTVALAQAELRTDPNFESYEHNERETAAITQRRRRVVRGDYAAAAYECYCALPLITDPVSRGLMAWAALEYGRLAGCEDPESSYDDDRIALWRA